MELVRQVLLELRCLHSMCWRFCLQVRGAGCAGCASRSVVQAWLWLGRDRTVYVLAQQLTTVGLQRC